MAHFSYKAQCPNGSAISGVLEADGFDAAKQQLAELNLTAVEVAEAKPPGPTRPVSGEDFIFFNEQLASLASAGLCLDEGLRQLARDVESPSLRRVIQAVAGDVQKGVPLEQAVANHEARMPVLYSRVVRAGVESGQLASSLTNLSQHLRLVSETKRIIAEALAYPVTAFAFAVVIVSALMVYVVPLFEEIFLEWDTSLPGLTLLLIDTARVFPTLAVIAGLIVAALAIAWIAARASPGGRRMRESVALSMPLIGPVMRASLISRFARSLALTVSSGVALPEALRLAAGATGSAKLDRDAEALASRVEQGGSLSAAADQAKLIPGMFGFVGDIAVSRNNLPQSLVQLAKAYDLKAAHGQTMLRGWLIPLSILFVGVTIGSCVVALFLPLVSLIHSVSGGG